MLRTKDGQEEVCPSVLQVLPKGKVLQVDCKDCIFKSSLKLPQCRKWVLQLAQKGADQIALKKRFYKFYSMEKHKRYLEELGKFVLCPRCEQTLGNRWEDPVRFFLLAHNRSCKQCNPELDKIKERLKSWVLIRQAVRAGKVSDAYKIFTAWGYPSFVSAFLDREKIGEEIDSYSVSKIRVSIHKIENRPDLLYFIHFPELGLSAKAAKQAAEAYKKLVMADWSFSAELLKEEVGRRVEELSMAAEPEDREVLKGLLLRHTLGFGALDTLLRDEAIQDLYIDSSSKLVHIVHEKYGECITNIILTEEGAEKISSKLRELSGRPLDASTPVLHTELEELGIRVCGITQPSTYSGTGFAFRRRKNSPWTLVEFMAAGMLDSTAAGFLSFLIDGQSSILVTGSRGSGKTSLLTSLMTEIPQSTRIVAIEDTAEIPVRALQTIGYKIEHLKTEAFAKGFEISAEDALRTSLRLGESTLVIGEVRGKEARALFEAMRIGAAGNAVMGTIHGSSAYDTWDRVVNDLGVPSTSFKAVDFVVVAGSIRKGESLKRYRKLLSIEEVGKDWKGEPVFKPLLTYNRKTGKWRVSGLEKSEILKHIAESKGMSIREVLQNIKLRGKMKAELFKLSKKNPKAMGADFLARANSMYYTLLESGKKNLFQKWKKWLRGELG